MPECCNSSKNIDRQQESKENKITSGHLSINSPDELVRDYTSDLDFYSVYIIPRTSEDTGALRTAHHHWLGPHDRQSLELVLDGDTGIAALSPARDPGATGKRPFVMDSRSDVDKPLFSPDFDISF